MKEGSNKRRIRSFMAGLLAFVLTVTSVLPGLPAMQVKAAEAKTWYVMTAGSGNSNDHHYETAGNAAVLLHQTERMQIGQTFSATFETINENTGAQQGDRIGFFYSYKDVNNWMYIGWNGAWYYEYKINGGNTSYPSITGLPSIAVGERATISVSMDREKLLVTVNGSQASITDQNLITLGEALGNDGRIGFRDGTANTGLRFTDATYAGKDMSDNWAFLADNDGQTLTREQVQLFKVSGTVKDSDNKPLANVRVRIGLESAQTDANGAFSVDMETGTYSVSASAPGYIAYAGEVEVTEAKTLEPIVLESKGSVNYDRYIGNNTIRAAIDDKFPQIYRYEVSLGGGKKGYIDGQTTKLSSVKINDTSITPVMGNVVINARDAVYPMTLKNEEAKIDMEMTVKISVPADTADSSNDLTWEVTNIKKKAGCAKINTIEVPDLNLVTITDGQEDAQFMGATISSNVNASGDQEITFEPGGGFSANNSFGYAYGFVSADGISAGVWSNSEKASDKRLTRNNGADCISLTSSEWYYEYGDLKASADYDGTPYSDLPCVKVCFALDENKDGVVDWQDGAIEYRDIMNNPYGSENTKDLVNYRISMNFSSQATNPYLKVADNIKKVYLATDGLPQAVMMKGYGSEGHDSANSEYGNIAERLGGLDEIKKLNTIAHQYNTQMGIHINAQEMYPEAQSFTDDIIQNPDARGWGWLDQSYNINREWDLGSGIRYKRLLQLYDQLNGTSLYANKWPGVAGQGQNETVADAATIQKTVAEHLNNVEDLDFMYLDVWYGDSWETRRIARQFNSLGWRFSTEFGAEGEYDSTWQHWATEGHYGGGGMKGLNSDVIRFIRNHQKDSFVLNWPMYGGTADNPLLGGYDTDGFEGWGSNNDFNHYMTTTFAINLPTKFLQHYKVYKWVNYSGVGEDVSPVGNHEKEITLKNDDDTVVVTRNETQRPNAGNTQDTTHFNFVERTITLNGTKVLDDVTYLLPWTDWETKEEKLYHYNYDGGETTWELLDGWKSLANVKVYKLTDVGRTEEKTINVTNGQITLTAEADTPYIVVKGDSRKKTVAEWSSYAHVKDTGFNGYANNESLSSSVWSGDVRDASVKVARMESGNKYLQMGSKEKKLAISTQISDLTPGENYVAQVYVDNKSDAKAWIKVTGANPQGQAPMSQYTLKSIAQNYVRCDAHNINAVEDDSMQVMLVSFKASAATATLTLEREEGEGVTYFDDIRIVHKTLSNYQEDGSFTQDFETVVGGLYPFVMGPAQGVDDQVTHLSERHDPYTQSGWGNLVLDDVINGKWSLKHHGNNTGIIYRTIPQNLHFDAGEIYNISFKYQAGHDRYYVVVGDGERVTKSFDCMPETCASKAGQKSTTEEFVFQLTGSESGQSWFGIASTSDPRSQGDSETAKARRAYGYVDFILDDLNVAKIGVSLSPSSVDVTNAADPINLTVKFDNVTDEPEIMWTSSNEEVAYVIPDATDGKKAKVHMVGFGDAVISAAMMLDGQEITLTSAISFPEYIQLPEDQQETIAGSNASGETSENKWAAVYANSEESSEHKGLAIDGNAETFWHVAWSGFTVSETNPAKLTVKAPKDIAGFNRLRLQQRKDLNNGIIHKYKVVVGAGFDENTHEVSDVTYTSPEMIVPAANRSGRAIETVLLPDDVTGQYIQVQILEGQGNFAAIAEIMLDKVASNHTDDNQTSIGSNATAAVTQAFTATLNEAKKKNEADYTAESWAGFKTALAAMEALNTATASQADLMEARTNLIAAQKNLVSLVSSAQTALKETLNTAKATYSEGQGYYTDQTWADFAKAYEAADKDKKSSDKAKLEQLKEDLAKATGALQIDTKKLEDDRAAAAAKVETGNTLYTDASWQRYINAYNAVKAAVEGGESDQNTLIGLQMTMLAAEKNLKFSPAAVITEVKDTFESEKGTYDQGRGTYTQASWTAYEKAYKELQAALNGNPLPEKLLELQQALKKVTLTVDTKWEEAKKALTDELKAVKAKYDKGAKAYTEDTWKAFKKAYDDAYNQRNATIASITTAKLNELTKALTRTSNGLKPASTSTITTPSLRVGESITDGNLKYVVTNASAKTVSVQASDSVKKSAKFKVNIKDTVVINKVPCTVTEVKAKAFNKFKKITQVTIGKNVTKIGSQAFNGCQSITKLTIKGDVQTFDKQCFSGCKKLKTVALKGKAVPKFGKNAFKGTPSNMKVTLSKALKKGKIKKNMIKNLQKAGVSKKATIK